MEAYIATLLFVASSNQSDYRPLYEERFVLVRAVDTQQATELAVDHGRASEHQYKSVEGYEISWHFKEVISVTPVVDEDLDKPVVELHGRFLRDIESFNKLRTIE